MKTIEERIKKINLICTDVDGVLTNGKLHYHSNKTHSKSFNVKDGAAIKWLQQSNIPVAFISGLYSLSTISRAEDLQVKDCFVGRMNKIQILEELCTKYKLNYEEVVYIGDDLMDIPVLKNVGLACCPQDSVEEVKIVSHWILPILGGMGIMRAVAEKVLKTQGKWKNILNSFML